MGYQLVLLAIAICVMLLPPLYLEWRSYKHRVLVPKVLQELQKLESIYEKKKYLTSWYAPRYYLKKIKKIRRRIKIIDPPSARAKHALFLKEFEEACQKNLSQVYAMWTG